MTHFIVINGPPKSGRTTIAKLLQKRLKGSIQSEIHAPLKHLFCSALGMKWQQLNGENPRDMLNGRSSVDAIRQLRYHLRSIYGPDILAQWLKFRVLGMKPVPEIVIVDDLLFQEDLDTLRVSQTTVIRVIRGLQNNFTPISSPDYTVINASDVAYLAKRADQIMGTLANVKE